MSLRLPSRALAPLVAAPLLVAALPACQRIEPPVPTPTADQWRRVTEQILDEAPTPMFASGAVFGDRVRLIGWDAEPAEVELGEDVTLTFYWEVLQPFDQRWWIFVHLDSANRQNLDHEAIDDLYPTLYWEPGQIIVDTVETTVGTDTPPGPLRLFVGFFRGEDRMPVTSPGESTLQDDGRLDVGTFEVSWTAPTYMIRRASDAIRIDGRGSDRAWTRAQRTGNWVSPVDGQDVDGVRSWGKMLWDDEALYVLMDARDDDVWATLTNRDANLWDEEVLELYLDPGNDGRDYLELQINPLNAIFDAHFVDPNNRDLETARAFNIPGIETAVYVNGDVSNRDDRDRSWTAEVRIPLDSVPGLREATHEGGVMGGNFYRYDRPADGEARTVAWSPVGGGTFHNPSRFGVVRFEAAPEAPEGSGAAAEGSADTPPLRSAPAPRRPSGNPLVRPPNGE